MGYISMSILMLIKNIFEKKYTDYWFKYSDKRNLRLDYFSGFFCLWNRTNNNVFPILSLERSSKDPRVERAISKWKKMLSAISYTWKRKREMTKTHAELNLPPHRLITETPARWGSRQQMIQHVLEQEKAISQVLKGERKTRHMVPTW